MSSHTTENKNENQKGSGFGDPDDTSLRVVERNVVLPKLLRQRAREHCPEEIQALTDCSRKAGICLPFKCRKENNLLNECYIKWYQNSELAEEVLQKYLSDRATYRRTGLTKQQRRNKDLLDSIGQVESRDTNSKP